MQIDKNKSFEIQKKSIIAKNVYEMQKKTLVLKNMFKN